MSHEDVRRDYERARNRQWYAKIAGAVIFGIGVAGLAANIADAVNADPSVQAANSTALEEDAGWMVAGGAIYGIGRSWERKANIYLAELLRREAFLLPAEPLHNEP